MSFLRTGQRAAQVSRHVPLRPPCGNGVTENTPAITEASVGGFDGSPALDFSQHSQKFWRGDGLDGALSQLAENITLHTVKDVLFIRLRPLGFIALQPFQGNSFKIIPGRACRCRLCSLFGDTGIDVVHQQLFGRVSALPRFFQANGRVRTDDKQLLLTHKAIRQTPGLFSCRSDV